MKNKSIRLIKELLTQNMVTEDDLMILQQDGRKGVQQLLKQYDRQQQERKKLMQMAREMKQFDTTFLQTSSDLIAGVDEAGRGPLAGPVVAAAVILPKDMHLMGLTDSKQLTEKKRNEFYDIITKKAIAYHVSILHHDAIDQLNILEATKRVMTDALHHLKPRPSVALIDAVELLGLPFPVQAIIKGDAKSQAIAAASVLAKVTRDRLMEEIHQQYAMYDFIHNKGYGTNKHVQALEEYGPCPYHRKSFAPVMQVMKRRQA